jgi:hypothetical protein
MGSHVVGTSKFGLQRRGSSIRQHGRLNRAGMGERGCPEAPAIPQEGEQMCPSSTKSFWLLGTEEPHQRLTTGGL